MTLRISSVASQPDLPSCLVQKESGVTSWPLLLQRHCGTVSYGSHVRSMHAARHRNNCHSSLIHDDTRLARPGHSLGQFPCERGVIYRSRGLGENLEAGRVKWIILAGKELDL